MTNQANALAIKAEIEAFREDLYIVMFYGRQANLLSIKDFDIFLPNSETNPKFDVLFISKENLAKFADEFSQLKIFGLIICEEQESRGKKTQKQKKRDMTAVVLYFKLMQ